MKYILLSQFFFFVWVGFSEPTIVIHSSNAMHKIEKGRHGGDFLFTGKALQFLGESEDLIFLGTSLEFTGTTRLGMIAGGKELDINGKVNNGIIAAGKDITIGDTIKGSNYFLCKNLVILPSALILGDVFAFCGTVAIEGPVEGNLYLGAGKIAINHTVTGDVKVHGGRLLISEEGQISGSLEYSTTEKLGESELQRIGGDVIFDNSKHAKGVWACKNAQWKLSDVFAFKMFLHIFFTLSFIIVGTLLLFLPVFKKLSKRLANRAFWQTALWGLIPVCMYPVLVLFCFILGITIPLAILLVLAFFPLFYLAYIIGAIRLGQFVSFKFRWNVQKLHYQFLIGVFISSILTLIPVIDFLTVLFFTGLGWGAFTSFIFNKPIAQSE